MALQSALDGDAVIKAIFRLLQNTVRCDFVNVCLRIVQHEAGDRNIACRMIDSRGRDFSEELLAGIFFQEHPGMPTLMANPGIRFINTREILPPDDVLHQTRFYRESMQIVGYRHAIGMFFWDNPPRVPEAVFSIYRGEGESDFEDADVASLDGLYPQIDAALRRARAMENERAVTQELRRMAAHASEATCVLDWDLKVASASRAAREKCALWNSGGASMALKLPPFRLPATLRAACDELKTHWLASLKSNPAAGAAKRLTIQHPDQPACQAGISIHLHQAAPLAKPGFRIDFRSEADQQPSETKGSPGLDQALTPDQRTLVRLVCEGKTNQQIATEVGRAVGTVKNALHTIFKQLNVQSRSMLIARSRH